ncbi:uncharacterized protein PV06_05228 [Exophiala oligosperma]|uniref:Major facilitator superfamily (MFS) profile domain-containing protein n=1 Tax=Exophiala oligosperma TaxID=215243 RepID=A0A0D2DNU5_9EURO|nr:uncharacterized protein PV06_05228 [Exophiala oligosperma]KIW44200.1 hypothetical protein PV06_05228 [Exophiala oligosperma]
MALEDHNDIVALETVTSRNQTVAEQSESFEDGNDNGHDHGQDAGPDLPPIDRGRAAWRMLFSAFIFESLLWGFPLSFGVFQNYYSRIPRFANQPYVSIIGTAATGITYLGAPLIIPLVKRLGRYRMVIIWVGWSMCIVGVLASSFAETLPAIIFTQGVMYGVGFALFEYPIIGMVNEFWVARRGMAYGILCASSGVSGVVMPVALEALLKRYGLSTTLRAVAIGIAILTGPLIPLLKGRIPLSQQQQQQQRRRRQQQQQQQQQQQEQPTTPGPTQHTDWGFLRVPLFWIYAVSNLLQGLGYFFPSLYLPSYATTLGMGARRGALLLALMSVAQVLGQFSFGYISDRRRFSVNTLMVTSTLVSAAAVLTLWGLARTFGLLCLFSLLYGFFGAGYTAMWARMGTTVTADTTAAFAAFGLFNFGKGLGNVFAGPIGANLLVDSVGDSDYGATKYKAVVLFTGSCMLASGASALTAYLKPFKATAVRE